jgi:hypothetical protein
MLAKKGIVWYIEENSYWKIENGIEVGKRKLVKKMENRK